MSAKYSHIFKKRPKVMYHLLSEIDGMLREGLGKDGFTIPSAASFVGYEDIRDAYVEQYLDINPEDLPNATARKAFEADPDAYKKKIAEEIPARVMFRQMMAAEDFFFGYHKKLGTLELFTADPTRIEEINNIEGKPFKFSSKDFYKKNLEGVIHALRIDVTYEDPENFELKTTTLNKNTHVDLNNYELVPILVINRVFTMFRTLLKSNRVLRIEQDYKGTVKERYLTEDVETLAKYTDNESFARLLKPYIYDLQAFMYLPVLGAPSTTVALSKVSIESINVIEIVPKTKIPVTPAVNPKGALAQGQVLEMFIDDLFNDAERTQELRQVLTWLVARGIEIPDHPTRSQVQTIVRRMDRGVAEQMIMNLPPYYKDQGRKIEGLFKEQFFVPIPSNSADLRSMVRERLVRLVVIGKSGAFYVVYGTNNVSILKEAYGDDYQRKFEGEGFRRGQVLLALQAGEDFEDAAAKLGVMLPVDRSAGKDMDGYRRQVEQELLSTSSEFTPGSGDNNDPVTIRSLFQDPDNPRSMYYRKIAPNRIQSAMILK